MRQLVMRLEYVDALKLAHPYTKGLESVYYCLSEEEAQAISRGEIPEAVAHRKKEDIEGKEGAKTMYATSFFVGLSIKPKEGTCRSSRYPLKPLAQLSLPKLARLGLASLTSPSPQASSSRW